MSAGRDGKLEKKRLMAQGRAFVPLIVAALAAAVVHWQRQRSLPAEVTVAWADAAHAQRDLNHPAWEGVAARLGGAALCSSPPPAAPGSVGKALWARVARPTASAAARCNSTSSSSNKTSSSSGHHQQLLIVILQQGAFDAQGLPAHLADTVPAEWWQPAKQQQQQQQQQQKRRRMVAYGGVAGLDSGLCGKVSVHARLRGVYSREVLSRIMPETWLLTEVEDLVLLDEQTKHGGSPAQEGGAANAASDGSAARAVAEEPSSSTAPRFIFKSHKHLQDSVLITRNPSEVTMGALSLALALARTVAQRHGRLHLASLERAAARVTQQRGR